jgi:hypothetical protein
MKKILINFAAVALLGLLSCSSGQDSPTDSHPSSSAFKPGRNKSTDATKKTDTTKKDSVKSDHDEH